MKMNTGTGNDAGILISGRGIGQSYARNVRSDTHVYIIPTDIKQN